MIDLTPALATYLNGLERRVAEAPADVTKQRIETYAYKVDQLGRLGYDVAEYIERVQRLRREK